MATDPEHRQRRAWSQNAGPWARAVRDGTIASRVEVTNAAVLTAVLDGSPASALDLGCGEGWLVRELLARRMRAHGVDASPELVALARAHGGGQYTVASYADLAAGRVRVEPADAVVANFALLGEGTTVAVVAAIPGWLTHGGRCVIQTVHPWVARGSGPYVSGWREGSWDGFGEDFADAPPWYFRTLGDWLGLLRSAGLEVTDVREPTGHDGVPRSLVLVSQVASPA